MNTKAAGIAVLLAICFCLAVLMAGGDTRDKKLKQEDPERYKKEMERRKRVLDN